VRNANTYIYTYSYSYANWNPAAHSYTEDSPIATPAPESMKE
jgi:hypothetical protein